MFEFLFGWRKASRCKKLIRRVQCRLKLLKNKRDSIIRQLRNDVVQLIKNGDFDSAFTRIEQLSRDQNIKVVYDLIDNFSEFVIINLPYIRKHRDCPNDVNEAVSSLIYASARCGDLPELQKLRKLFGERYGQRFALTAVELLPGNLVDQKVIDNLRVKSVSGNLKTSLLKEIAIDNNLELDHLEADEKSKLQVDQVGLSEKNGFATLNESEKIEDGFSGGSNSSSCRLSSASLQQKSESPAHFSERSIVYLDDVEEFEAKEGGSDRDQRVFMFKSVSSVRENSAVTSTTVSGSYRDQIGQLSEHSDGKTSSKGSCKKVPVKRRLDMKYDFVEKEIHKSPVSVRNMKDVEYAFYYGDTGDSSSDGEVYSYRSLPQKKHHQKISVGSLHSSSKVDHQNLLSPTKIPYRSKVAAEIRARVDEKGARNSLNTPEVACAPIPQKSMIKESEIGVVCKISGESLHSSSKVDHQNLLSAPKSPYRSSKLAQEIRVRVNEKSARNSMNTPEVACAPIPQKSMVKDSEIGVVCFFTPSQSYKLNEHNKETEEAEVIDCRRSCASSHDSCSRATSPWGKKQPPYMRAMTMPPERPNGTTRHPIPRSISSLSQQPEYSNGCSSSLSSCSHVHPKLPNYDDLEARFRALKKEQP